MHSKKVLAGIAVVTTLLIFAMSASAADTTVVVTGDTAAGENQPGWLFNRDASTSTPLEFNSDEASIGAGSLYVLPIGATAADKFIGEYFLLEPIADVGSITYDFFIGSGGEVSDADHFYLNVYANFGESAPTKFYDCRYNIVPTTGSTGSFTTVTFDPTQPYPVTTRTGASASPYACPAIPADMDDLSNGSTIRMFALNVGDTSANDSGLDGYLDNVVVTLDGMSTAFDFEPYTPCSFSTVGTTIHLDGDCTTDETIFVPDGFTLDGDGYTITAIDPTAGHFTGAVVQNAGTTAHVTNLTVRTDGLANVCDASDDRLRGIMFEGASGSITDNAVIDINQGPSGCQEGNAIEVRNAPFDGSHPSIQNVDIVDNVIVDYQKTGILANGDVSVKVSGNSVDGLGPVPNIAQNGIQLGFGARGQVRDNEIAGSWFTGANWTAAGILIFESDGVIVQGNDVSGSQTGIAVETWCWFAPSATNNKVQHNNVDGAEFGITVFSVDFAGLTQCDPSADNNKVNHNTLESVDGDVGVFIGVSDDPGSSFEPGADNNKAIKNDISGFDDEILDTGTNSKINPQP